MAEKLFSVRPKLVESLDEELIKQLLDNLLHDGVLNKGENAAILEKTNVNADRARNLIDKVIAKGDGASNKMITHLQKRDPALCSKLGLSQCPPAQTSPEPKNEQQWATSLIPATDGFYQKKTLDTSVYLTSSKSMRNRVALLITNINFANSDQNRKGAEKDEENMEKLLKNLGYDVEKLQDLTAKKMDEALSHFAKHPKLKHTDCVFVVIMSHGILGAVLGINNDEFPLDNIYEHLGPERCPALVDKPKVIIIQACRGTHAGAVTVNEGVGSDVASDGSPEDVIEDDRLKFVHKEKDFISLLSCTPHSVAYREKNKGSFLIQYIVDVFNTCAHEEHIEELYMKVMQRFEKLEIEEKKQMPVKDRCTLTKYLYLFPGH